MAGIPKLVPNARLRTTLLREIGRTHTADLHVDYDPDFDALRLLVVPSMGNVIVAHYVDGNVAILYRASDFEVVGLHIEAFAHSFLPRHEAVRRIWRLSDTGVQLNDMGDMLVRVEMMKPKVAREVAEATKDVTGEMGEGLLAALR
jgi:hypothetical protein